MAKVPTQIDEYIGISNTTITDGTTAVIEAFVPEFLPVDGGSLDECMTSTVKLTDPTVKDAKPEETEFKRYKTVKCFYWGSGDRNQLIPCVAKGELVRIFNFGGSENYYWRGAGRDAGLRRHERVRWFAMNLPTTVDKGSYPDVDDKNCYFVEMNTNKKDKNIRIHTSISDGEEFPYDIIIYPTESKLIITDNNGGNFIQLESKERRWTIQNKDESQIILDKENILIKCKDTITLDAGKNIVQKAGTDITSTAGSNVSTEAGANISRKAGANISAECVDMSINASGSISGKGSGISVNGTKVNIKGSSGECDIGKIKLTQHTHPVPPHCPGPGKTTPPTP